MTWQEKLAKTFENITIDDLKQRTIGQLLTGINDEFHKNFLTAEYYKEFVKICEVEINKILIPSSSKGICYGIDLVSLTKAELEGLLDVQEKDKTVDMFLQENQAKFEKCKKLAPLITTMLDKFETNIIHFGAYDRHLGGVYLSNNDTLNLKFDQPKPRSFNFGYGKDELSQHIPTIVHELEHKVDFNSSELSEILDNFAVSMLVDIKSDNLEEYKLQVIKIAKDIASFFDEQIEGYINELKSSMASAMDQDSVIKCFNHQFVREIIPNLMGLYYGKDSEDIERLIKGKIELVTINKILANIYKAFGAEGKRSQESNFYFVQNFVGKAKTESAIKDLNKNLIAVLSEVTKLNDEINNFASYSSKIISFFQDYKKQFAETLKITEQRDLDIIVDSFSRSCDIVLSSSIDDLKEKISFLKSMVANNKAIIQKGIDKIGPRTDKIKLSDIEGIDIEALSSSDVKLPSQKKRRVDIASQDLKKSSEGKIGANLTQINYVEEAMIKLGLEKGAVISTVSMLNFPDSEISGQPTLEMALSQCKSMEQNKHQIIILKVHAGDTNFSANVNENNHYVGLVIYKNQYDKYAITYIDPTGRPIHADIAGIVKDQLAEASIANEGKIISSVIQLQTFESEQGRIMIDGTNCGPFLAYLTSLSIGGSELESDQRKITSKVESDSFGAELRNYYEDSTSQIPALEPHLNKHLRLATKSYLQTSNIKALLQNHIQYDLKLESEIIFLQEVIHTSIQKAAQDFDCLVFAKSKNPLGENFEMMDDKLSYHSTNNSKIQLFPESNHLIDHKIHIKSLIASITKGELDKSNAIIVIERKQDGKNLGMSDVILLSKLIKKEEELNKQRSDKGISQINLIPNEIRVSLIYQDALLYKIAEENGVKVIGIDKSKISANKRLNPELYNQEREKYMADLLSIIANNYPNHNIIFPVGESHCEAISDFVKQDRVNHRQFELKKPQPENQDLGQGLGAKNQVSTTSLELFDRIYDELSIADKRLESIKERIKDQSRKSQVLTKKKSHFVALEAIESDKSNIAR